MRVRIPIKVHRFLVVIAIAALLCGLVPSRLYALTTNPAPAAKISFTFDDGYASVATQAAPTLATYGLKGTSYVISGCVGMTTTPNTCHADTNKKYMTWAQVTALQNTSGWEIGSHTVTHPYLASSDATDGQPNVLTPAQVTQELTQSKADLISHGLNVVDFASPYGDYNNAVLAQIAKYYGSHRGFADVNNNTWPYNDLLLNNYPVQAGVTVTQVKSKIDQAITNKNWLVLTFHDIKANPSTNPDDYEYSPTDLGQIAAYVKSKQDAGLLQPVTINQGLVTSDTNLLTNSSFNSGISGGWTTDAPTAVTLDTGNNGSYPDATNSVKFVAGASNAHLFSPKVTVNPSETYMLKNFINVAAISSGEFAFYIDEYDANGNWISGQYKTAERTSFVENMNFTYKPSTLAVSKASLQVIATGGSGITAYFDNPQWFSLSTTVTPPPTNLVPNGTFDAGIGAGWTTNDAVNIKADAANHGSPANPINSVSLTASTANRHLFSPKVAVVSTKTYSLASYLNITARTNNEIGFYIDEYNSSGAWISGQYKTGVVTPGVSNVSFNYTPSSSSVTSASLQVISTANSGIKAYYDDVKWYAN